MSNCILLHFHCCLLFADVPLHLFASHSQNYLRLLVCLPCILCHILLLFPLYRHRLHWSSSELLMCMKDCLLLTCLLCLVLLRRLAAVSMPFFRLPHWISRLCLVLHPILSLQNSMSCLLSDYLLLVFHCFRLLWVSVLRLLGLHLQSYCRLSVCLPCTLYHNWLPFRLLHYHLHWSSLALLSFVLDCSLLMCLLHLVTWCRVLHWFYRLLH